MSQMRSSVTSLPRCQRSRTHFCTRGENAGQSVFNLSPRTSFSIGSSSSPSFASGCMSMVSKLFRSQPGSSRIGLFQFGRRQRAFAFHERVDFLPVRRRSASANLFLRPGHADVCQCHRPTKLEKLRAVLGRNFLAGDGTGGNDAVVKARDKLGRTAVRLDNGRAVSNLELWLLASLQKDFSETRC